MADKQEQKITVTSDIDILNQKISEKVAEGVDRNFLIDRQNLAGKRLLRLLPFQIFLLIADADGKTDKKEVHAFKDFLNQREKHCSNPYTRRMFHATILNYTSLTNRYLSEQISKDINVVKSAMAYVGLCASPRIVSSICDDLRDLAVAIAEASGGFIGMTSPISEAEQAAIDSLNQVFDDAIANAHGEDKPQKGWMDI